MKDEDFPLKYLGKLPTLSCTNMFINGYNLFDKDTPKVV